MVKTRSSTRGRSVTSYDETPAEEELEEQLEDYNRKNSRATGRKRNRSDFENNSGDEADDDSFPPPKRQRKSTRLNPSPSLSPFQTSIRRSTRLIAREQTKDIAGDDAGDDDDGNDDVIPAENKENRNSANQSRRRSSRLSRSSKASEEPIDGKNQEQQDHDDDESRRSNRRRSGRFRGRYTDVPSAAEEDNSRPAGTHHSDSSEYDSRDLARDEVAEVEEEQVAEEDHDDESEFEDDDDDAPRRKSRRLKNQPRKTYFNDGEQAWAAQVTRRGGRSARSAPGSGRRDRRSVQSADDEQDQFQRRSTRVRRQTQRYTPEYTRKVKNLPDTDPKGISRNRPRRAISRPNYDTDTSNGSGDSSDADEAVTTRSASRKSRRRWRKHHRRHRSRSALAYGSDSSGGSNSSYSTDTYMDMRARKRIARDRAKIQPINLQELGLYHEDMAPSQKKPTNADITPMEIDLKVDWTMVGGLEGHIQKLKEMVVLPLLYPKEFAQFKMNPPKGVLFHGPPGTGKTLVARILAAQCSTPGQKVSFYMRKGADCLSKWVGEAERQLRLLFDEAHKNQPSVIFFDEIDGLAPVRSSRQDQIHSSIVSTLLALMDGLDARGQIIVIGATNRPDAIDPALRRPGRFDRELCFNLPSRAARRQILTIHTRSWDPKLEDKVLDFLANETVGYCGADLEALCREAFLSAVRRTFPQIYESNVRLQIEPDNLRVNEEDFEKALSDITPSSHRSSVVFARPLTEIIRPLLNPSLQKIQMQIEKIFALRKEESNIVAHASAAVAAAAVPVSEQKRTLQHFKYLIHGGTPECGQIHLGCAVLHLLEEYPLYSLDLPTLFGDAKTRSAEEGCLQAFKEARQNTPSVLYWPHIDRWWLTATDQLRSSISLLIRDMPRECPVFLLATSDSAFQAMPDELQQMFANEGKFELSAERISQSDLTAFWQQLFEYCVELPKRKPPPPSQYPTLPIASPPPAEMEAKAVRNRKEELRAADTDCINLRTYLRSTANRLIKHFKDFIDRFDHDGVASNNLSLFDIRQRNNERRYPTVGAFLNDIDTLVTNTKNSANYDSLKARQLVNEACQLQDTSLSMVNQINRDMAQRCQQIAAKYERSSHSTTVSASAAPSASRRSVRFSSQSVIPAPDESHPSDDDISQSTKDGRKKSKIEVGDDADDDDAEAEEATIDNPSGETESVAAGAMASVPFTAESTPAANGEARVNISRSDLKGIVAKLAVKSKGFSVDECEQHLYGLLRIVYNYSDLWDRSNLVKELQTYVSERLQ